MAETNNSGQPEAKQSNEGTEHGQEMQNGLDGPCPWGVDGQKI